MEKEKLEIVLEEVLEEFRSMRGAVEELKQQVWQLKERGENFEKKLESIKPVALSVETGPIQGIITVGLDRIQKVMAEQPKTVVHERRLLLFPEHYISEYYRVIFRLILWLTLASALYYLFILGRQTLQNVKEIRLRELELTHAQDFIRPLSEPQQTRVGKQKTEKTSSDTKKPKGRKCKN
jgi:hypothetical protein